jgi:hypothetical protein
MSNGIIVGNTTICVVERTRTGMSSEFYGSRLKMVLEELNSGKIGDGIHGSQAHLYALQKVIGRCQRIMISIDEGAEDLQRSKHRGSHCGQRDV